jgi:hypothetical protein
MHTALNKAQLLELALRYPPPFAIADWVREEMYELEVAVNNHAGGAAELDALFDAMGAIILLMTLYDRTEIQTAFANYVQSQRKRGRPSSHWEGILGEVASELAKAETTVHKRRMKSSMEVYLRRIEKVSAEG